MQHATFLQVSVKFVDLQSPTYAKSKRICEFWLRGTGHGVLQNPQHSLAPNTTCLYHLQVGIHHRKFGIQNWAESGRPLSKCPDLPQSCVAFRTKFCFPIPGYGSTLAGRDQHPAEIGRLLDVADALQGVDLRHEV